VAVFFIEPLFATLDVVLHVHLPCTRLTSCRGGWRINAPSGRILAVVQARQPSVSAQCRIGPLYVFELKRRTQRIRDDSSGDASRSAAIDTITTSAHRRHRLVSEGLFHIRQAGAGPKILYIAETGDTRQELNCAIRRKGTVPLPHKPGASMPSGPPLGVQRRCGAEFRGLRSFSLRPDAFALLGVQAG